MKLLTLGAVGALALLAGCASLSTEAVTEAPPTASTPADAPSTSSPTPDDGQEQLDEALREAAYDSDVEGAEVLLAEGADVNEMSKTIESAYLIAARQADLPFMRLMLAGGADVTATDTWGSTGLTRAAERGSYLVAGALLQAGTDPAHVNTLGYQAIHEAVWLGRDTDDYVDTVRVLAAAGVALDVPSEAEQLTPLQMAMDRGFTRIEATLRAQLEGEPTVDPNAALADAIRADDADAAARALRDGAELNMLAADTTPFLTALDGERDATLRLFVALGVDAGLADADGRTPLMAAAAAGNADLVALIADAPGLALNAADSGGHTALMHAVLGGDGGDRYQRIVRSLLAAGADPATTDPEGRTALDLASAAGHEQLVAILAEAG